MNNTITFGQMVRSMRTKQQLTQTQFAEILAPQVRGLTQGRLSDLERGLLHPSGRQVAVLLDVLGAGLHERIQALTLLSQEGAV
jgi:transcriptional regulator with XRE-family HTH domain